MADESGETSVRFLMSSTFAVERVGRGESRWARSGLPDQPTSPVHCIPAQLMPPAASASMENMGRWTRDLSQQKCRRAPGS